MKKKHKNKMINKKQIRKFSWTTGQMIMIFITFYVGAWFALFVGLYSFLMGMDFCRNNWVHNMPKVIVTNEIIKKEDIKK